MPTAIIHLHLQRYADLDAASEARLRAHVTAEDEAGLVRHRESRQRQALVRGLLREKLGEACGVPPATLRFERDLQGKPRLGTFPIAFNVSHTEHACAIAWSSAPLDIGVDIEDISRPFHEARLAEHAFSAGELLAWQQAVVPRRRWLSIWTRKEALLKATGLGIRISLASIDTEKGEPPGHFSHARLGQLRYRSWVTTEQVFSLAWRLNPAQEVRVRLGGSLPGLEPVDS